MQPFSIRHGKALLEQRIRVSMKDRLRARLWMTVKKYNEQYWYQPDPSDNWSSQTDHIPPNKSIPTERGFFFVMVPLWILPFSLH